MRQRDEAQKPAEPGERQGDPYRGNDDGRRDERCAGPAFQKRNLRRTNDMDDERLREQRF